MEILYTIFLIFNRLRTFRLAVVDLNRGVAVSGLDVLLVWGVVLLWFPKKKLKKSCLNSIQNYPNPAQNPPKTIPNQWKYVLGPFSAPSCGQGGSRTPTPGRGTRLLEPFWQKIVLQGSILGPPEIPKWLQNRTFVHRLALGPSKNYLWKGVWIKHEILMKNQC